MNRFTKPFAGSMLALCCAMGAAYGQSATTTPQPSTTTSALPASMPGSSDHAAYKEQHDQIKATYKSAMSQCDSLADNAKDVCKAQAKGDRDKAYAKLDADMKPTPAHTEKLAEATADDDYGVAMAKCGALTGNDKDVCKANAKDAKKSAYADAKANKKVALAKSDARDTKTDAAYDDAKAKCDAMASGTSKDQCEANVKSSYGK